MNPQEYNPNDPKWDDFFAFFTPYGYENANPYPRPFRGGAGDVLIDLIDMLNWLNPFMPGQPGESKFPNTDQTPLRRQQQWEREKLWYYSPPFLPIDGPGGGVHGI